MRSLLICTAIMLSIGVYNDYQHGTFNYRYEARAAEAGVNPAAYRHIP